MNYLDALRLAAGDVIVFQRPGEPEQTATIIGDIHVYPGPALVVYVPIVGGSVNRLHITRADSRAHVEHEGAQP